MITKVKQSTDDRMYRHTDRGKISSHKLTFLCNLTRYEGNYHNFFFNIHHHASATVMLYTVQTKYNWALYHSERQCTMWKNLSQSPHFHSFAKLWHIIIIKYMQKIALRAWWMRAKFNVYSMIKCTFCMFKWWSWQDNVVQVLTKWVNVFNLRLLSYCKLQSLHIL